MNQAKKLILHKISHANNSKHYRSFLFLSYQKISDFFLSVHTSEHVIRQVIFSLVYNKDLKKSDGTVSGSGFNKVQTYTLKKIRFAICSNYLIKFSWNNTSLQFFLKGHFNCVMVSPLKFIKTSKLTSFLHVVPTQIDCVEPNFFFKAYEFWLQTCSLRWSCFNKIREIKSKRLISRPSKHLWYKKQPWKMLMTSELFNNIATLNTFF